ncbi:hypothetical protein MPDQ_001694 [Monascus purpureus]|uniref:Mso1 N-terminal domain-containing protein n=1 Tax=Monascus purpureus TaxID=5098 RepID=A0A507QQS7_MONPU|nr:hypothetical protein MPDQ_001694 [Monascus purpureus]BDD61757.1 hypothetical protein MAP00_006783 [Monascus purpureus]
MASYFSSITTSSAISNLGTRLNSLRRAITSGEESDDSDNEDCSHVSNVLRAYYVEKGRPFPPWLPPDPKGHSQTPARMIATSQLPQGGYGQSPTATSFGRSGGLSDLWGDSGSSPQAPAAQTSSLRRGRAPASSGQLSVSPGSSGRLSPRGPSPAASRPLPSQRAGSFQSVPSHRTSMDGGPSAQERLRARLQGGRSGSAQSAPLTAKNEDPRYGYNSPISRKPLGSPSGERMWGSR